MERIGGVVLATGVVTACLGGHPCFAAGEEAAKPPVKIEYANGFKFTSPDKAFSLRLFGGIQMRHTYTDFDERVSGNEEDVSNFFVRRARLWWDGHAFSPKFTYYFHLQLEPTSAVNLHDAWVQYAFSDAFRVGFGRNKIPYGAEFLASAFSLNFVERSIMYGETDISQGSAALWPGGGTAPFLLSTENQYTGFPTGGLSLFRSQGVMISGRKGLGGDATVTWETGVWNGRNSRGLSNPDSKMLTSARVTLFPWGAFDTTTQGDLEGLARPKMAVMLSAYRDGGRHNRDAGGAAVTPYETRDTGTNLALLTRFRGANVELEWGEERYDMRRPGPGPWEFERAGWRVAAGYFVVPRRVEVVARTSRLERLKDPSREAALRSGLGLARIEHNGVYVSAVEEYLSEVIAGVNLYFGHGHQHKLYFDLASLRRHFLDEGQGAPGSQEDRRLRTMIQIRF